MPIEKMKRIAREKYGKELTDEQAVQYAEKFGKLSDNELDNVSGGCDEFQVFCPLCGSSNIESQGLGNRVNGISCNDCGNQW